MDSYKPPTPADPQSVLGAETKPVVCPHCDTGYDSVPRKSFLGFQKHTCICCNENFSYPLYKGYRIAYWVLLVLALTFFSRAPQGSQPSIFIMLMIFAVVVDGWLVWQRK